MSETSKPETVPTTYQQPLSDDVTNGTSWYPSTVEYSKIPDDRLQTHPHELLLLYWAYQRLHKDVGDDVSSGQRYLTELSNMAKDGIIQRHTVTVTPHIEPRERTRIVPDSGNYIIVQHTPDDIGDCCVAIILKPDTLGFHRAEIFSSKSVDKTKAAECLGLTLGSLTFDKLETFAKADEQSGISDGNVSVFLQDYTLCLNKKINVQYAGGLDLFKHFGRPFFMRTDEEMKVCPGISNDNWITSGTDLIGFLRPDVWAMYVKYGEKPGHDCEITCVIRVHKSQEHHTQVSDIVSRLTRAWERALVDFHEMVALRTPSEYIPRLFREYGGKTVLSCRTFDKNPQPYREDLKGAREFTQALRDCLLYHIDNGSLRPFGEFEYFHSFKWRFQGVFSSESYVSNHHVFIYVDTWKLAAMIDKPDSRVLECMPNFVEIGVVKHAQAIESEVQTAQAEAAQSFSPVVDTLQQALASDVTAFALQQKSAWYRLRQLLKS